MPSRFDFDGSMIIGKNTMALKYHRDGNGWSVKAALLSCGEYKLDELPVDLCRKIMMDPDELDNFRLPDFFNSIQLIPKTMTLKCAKDKKSTPTLITESTPMLITESSSTLITLYVDNRI